MSGDIITASGTRFFIGQAVAAAAADSLGEFQAMTGWTEVGLVESLGAFGDTSNLVTFAAIGDARVRKSKGARDAGTLEVKVAHDPADTGQLAMEAAEETSSGYAFKVILPDAGNTIKYFQGLVNSQPLEVGTNDNVVTKTYQVAINSAIFTDS